MLSASRVLSYSSINATCTPNPRTLAEFFRAIGHVTHRAILMERQSTTTTSGFHSAKSVQRSPNGVCHFGLVMRSAARCLCRLSGCNTDSTQPVIKAERQWHYVAYTQTTEWIDAKLSKCCTLSICGRNLKITSASQGTLIHVFAAISDSSASDQPEYPRIKSHRLIQCVNCQR